MAAGEPLTASERQSISSPFDSRASSTCTAGGVSHATLRPVDECKPNGPMLWVAGGMMATSAGLIVYGGGRDYTVYPATPSVRWRVRF